MNQVNKQDIEMLEKLYNVKVEHIGVNSSRHYSFDINDNTFFPYKIKDKFELNLIEILNEEKMRIYVIGL